MSLPYSRLRDDLTDVIARAAAERTVLRLDGDANLYCPPHSHVRRFAEWAHRTRRGLCAYAVDHTSPDTPGDESELDAFDRCAAPRVSTRAGLEALVVAHDEPLAHTLAERRLVTSPIDGDEEARAFATARFQQLFLPATLTDVQVFRAGVHELLRIVTAAVRACADSPGAVVLAPVGIDLTQGGHGVVDVVEELTGAVLAEWLARESCDGPRVVYVPVVNALTGQVMTRRRAHDIARVVLRYNQRHRDSPVFVFADDSLIDGCHTEVIEHEIRSIGAVTGADLGDPSLGRMTDWTLSALSPRMALPTTRIVFTATRNRWLQHVVHRSSGDRTHADTTPIDELIAAAALCLTPTQWFDEANDHTVHNLHALRDMALNFNTAECGFDGLAVGDHTAGGWHTTLRFHQRLVPSTIMSGVDLFHALLEPDATQSTSVALLPGELFGWRYDPLAVEPSLVLRVNLSLPSDAFADFLWHLQQIATDLWQRAWREQCQIHRSWRASFAKEHEVVG